MREPTEEQIERAVSQLVDHMRAQLEQAGMDASPEAVREACKRRLRARLALCEQPFPGELMVPSAFVK